MRKIITLLFCGFVLTACQTADKITKLNSPVEGTVYNSVASDYLPMLTTAMLLDFSDGSQALVYQVETYKSDKFGNREKANYTIASGSVNEHLAALNKFIDWNDKAKSRGDQFTKEIARVKTVNGYSVYTFHSGNKYSNLLDVCFTSPENAPCLIQSVTFDVKNVKRIIEDVNKFKDGKFKHLDTSIYQ